MADKFILGFPISEKTADSVLSQDGTTGRVDIKNIGVPTLRLHNTDASVVSDQVIGDIDFYQSDASGGAAAGVGVVSKIRSINENVFSGVAGLAFHTGSATTITERMRITSTGSVLIGTEEVPNGTSIYGSGFVQTSNSRMNLNLATSSSALNAHIYFFNPNGVAGYIATNGSATVYSTSSDYRLKEDWQPMAGALDRVDALKPINFAWKVDDSRVDGFLAHELAEVVPEAVTGEKDAVEDYEVTPAVLDDEGNVIEEAVMGTRPVYQGIDQSKIVPLLVAAIQELKAEIELLKLNN